MISELAILLSHTIAQYIGIRPESQSQSEEDIILRIKLDITERSDQIRQTAHSEGETREALPGTTFTKEQNDFIADIEAIFNQWNIKIKESLIAIFSGQRLEATERAAVKIVKGLENISLGDTEKGISQILQGSYAIPNKSQAAETELRGGLDELLQLLRSKDGGSAVPIVKDTLAEVRKHIPPRGKQTN